MENRGKPGCLQKKLFKTARYIHNACDKNIPDLGQRLPCPRARPDRPVSDRDVSLMTPRTKRSINRNEQCLRVAENRTQVLLFTCQKREEEALSEMGIPYRKIVL